MGSPSFGIRSPSKGNHQSPTERAYKRIAPKRFPKVMHSLCMTFFFPEQGKIVPTLWINKGKRRENWRK